MPPEPLLPEPAFEPLGKRHDRSRFDCGRPELDDYLHRQAGQDVRRRVAAAYVLAREGRVAAYYTLSATSVLLADLPDLAPKLPRYPTVPCVLIGRLAVDRASAGQGLGGAAVMDAASRTLASGIGAVGMVVDALDEAAAGFYARLGFTALPSARAETGAQAGAATGQGGSLFMPLATLARAL